jgi:hypothetical protein
MNKLIMPEPVEAVEDRPRCPSCKYYFNHHPLEPKADGSCHFNPPQVCALGMQQDRLGRGIPITMAFWPAVNPKDWCGKHERKLDA